MPNTNTPQNTSHKNTSPPSIRQPAQAGQFYPADTHTMHRDVSHWLNQQSQPIESRPVHAVMLPHAGWLYCGRVMGQTVRRTTIPDRVIIIGPKHTALGPPWSVASHHTWHMPDTDIAIDTDVRTQLLNLVPDLPCETDAHRDEHSAEVILPFLSHFQPNIRVIPIAIGNITRTQFNSLADALRQLHEQTQCLLVISSDMNHFANDTENRRRDHLAIDAMRTGDPDTLLTTCAQNHISMCGVIPAAIVLTALRDQLSNIDLIDYDTSATASHDTSQVVGYAGMQLR